MRFSATLLSIAGLVAFTQSAAIEKRVNAPAPCSQSGTGKFGTFSVSPNQNVPRNQPITINYEQNCAEQGDVYPQELYVTIDQAQAGPLQFLAGLPIPSQEYGQPISLDTNVPNGPLPGGVSGDDIVFAGTITYTTKENPGVTYMYRFETPFSINETAPAFQGESR